MGTRSFPGVEAAGAWGWPPTPHLVRRGSRKSRAIPLLTLRSFVAHKTGENLPALFGTYKKAYITEMCKCKICPALRQGKMWFITDVLIKICIFGNVLSCRFVNNIWPYEWSLWPYPLDRAAQSSVVCLTLKKKSLNSFEMQVTFHQTTQRNISEKKNRNKYLILNILSQQVSPNASQRDRFSSSLHGLARSAHQRHATVTTGTRKPHQRPHVLFVSARLRRRHFGCHYSSSRVGRMHYWHCIGKDSRWRNLS